MEWTIASGSGGCARNKENCRSNFRGLEDLSKKRKKLGQLGSRLLSPPFPEGAGGRERFRGLNRNTSSSRNLWNRLNLGWSCRSGHRSSQSLGMSSLPTGWRCVLLLEAVRTGTFPSSLQIHRVWCKISIDRFRYRCRYRYRFDGSAIVVLLRSSWSLGGVKKGATSACGVPAASSRGAYCDRKSH